MRSHSPWMTEDVALFADNVDRFVQRELIPHASRWEQERCVDREAWRKAGAAGLLCVSIPEEYGGGGGTRAHDAVVAQAFWRTGLGGGFGTGIGVSCGLVAHYILAYGTCEQKRRWLPGMATGEIVAAIAMTEPATGSDLQRVRTTARRHDRGYLINGQKTFISNGQNADLVLVVAKTDPDAAASGISLVAIETANASGFSRGRKLDKIGMHAQDTSELFFDDAKVPQENLLGGVEGRGFEQLMLELAWERMSCAISAVSMMEGAVGVTIEYVKGRQAFGRPILDFQNTQFTLAECKTLVSVARTYIDQMMVMQLAGEMDPTTAAMAKLWTTDTLWSVVDECLQLHGGYGYMTEYPIARFWTDARVMRIYAGTNEIMKRIVARSL